MTTGVSTFDQSLNTTLEWLKDLQEEMGLDNEQRAFRVMRAVLHALRDRLTIEDGGFCRTIANAPAERNYHG
jgi:uncharacterized protein (DUF2267 family)